MALSRSETDVIAKGFRDLSQAVAALAVRVETLEQVLIAQLDDETARETPAETPR
jgi:hypothetical protein